MTGAARDRNAANAPDERYDSLIHVGSSTWSIAVPNGTYTVHVAVGDPSYADVVSKLMFNGVLTINGSTSSSQRWLEGTNTITVTSGLITVSEQAGSYDKIDYIDITSTGASVPAVPTGLTAAAGNAQASLNWAAATAATSYNIYRSTSSGGEGSTPYRTGVTTTSYTGLTNGTKYYYQVTAVNSAGESGKSSEVSAMPQLALPVAPTGLSATAGNAQVSLTWTASSGATTYNLYRSTTSGGEGSTPYRTGVTTTSFTDIGLTNGTKYYYQVTAVNSAGQSGKSSEVSATPSIVVAQIDFVTPTALPASGYLADAGAVYSTTRGYGWNIDLSGNTRVRGVNPDPRLDSFVFSQAPATWAYGLPNGQYLVSLASGDASWAQGPHQIVVNGVTAINGVSTAVNQYVTVTDLPVTVSSGQLTVVIGGTTGNTMLNYLIVKQGAAPTIPSAPTGLNATAANAQVSLTWTGSSGAASYNIYRSTTSGGEGSTPYRTGITSTSFTDTGLTNGTRHYYQVSAVNSAGESGKSAEVFATPQLTAPTTPTGLIATPRNAQVLLTWTGSSGAASYNIYRSTTAGGEGSTPYRTGITTTSHTDTGLTNLTQNQLDRVVAAAIQLWAATGLSSTQVSALQQVQFVITDLPTGCLAKRAATRSPSTATPPATAGRWARLWPRTRSIC